MNRGQFVRVIEGFCKHCGLEEPERILHGGPIAVNDVVFSLIYSEEVNPDLLFMYCDFGNVPLGQELEAYRALLEANLALYDGKGPSFTISPETGRVVLAALCVLVDTSPQVLHDQLVHMAEKAKAWRADPFFGSKPPSKPKRRESQLMYHR